MNAPAVHRGDGRGREEKQLSDNAVDSAANIDEKQQNKPEIDPESWSKLGGNTKPSRDHQQKRRSGR